MAILNMWKTLFNDSSVILLATEPDAFYHPRSGYRSETPHQSKSGKY